MFVVIFFFSFVLSISIMSSTGVAGCSRKRGAMLREETKMIAGVKVYLKERELARAKQVGGKGSMRRKIKGRRHKEEEGGNHDKHNPQPFDCVYYNKINPMLAEVPLIEEVNLFRDDGTFINIRKPKGLCNFYFSCSIIIIN